MVAITGSVGKTTTKDMTAALLAQRGPGPEDGGNLNNQYGLPLTLLRLRPQHRFAVLELGMSAAGELRALSAVARPDVAVITLVAPVHLEFFDSVEAIAAAKAEILEGLAPGGVAVLNGDDPQLRRVGEAHRAAARDLVRPRPRLPRRPPRTGAAPSTACASTCAWAAARWTWRCRCPARTSSRTSWPPRRSPITWDSRPNRSRQRRSTCARPAIAARSCACARA